MKTFYKKNMVCDRCILSVSNLFEKYDISQIKLGEVRVSKNIPNYEEKLIIEKLKKSALKYQFLKIQYFQIKLNPKLQR